MKPVVLVVVGFLFLGLVATGGVVIALIAQRGKSLETPQDPSGRTSGTALSEGTTSDNNDVETASDHPLNGEQIYPRLVRGSALILTPPADAGSGLVVHTGRRLVVTNYHVVGRESKVAVVFPLYDGSGALITDTRKYLSRSREIAVPGQVVDRDSSRDLALIRVERIPERAGALPLARRPAATGATVYSVGGSGTDDNLLWRLTKGIVRGRAQRRDMTDHGRLDCMILETDAPVNPGDSGGAVMNEQGELIAVVSHFHTRQRQVSGNIDVDEVRAFLSRHLP
jgi:S1-C subfamily serine protease